MTSEKLAKILAVILGPHVWLPILFVIVIMKSGLTPNQLVIIFPSVLILEVIIPIAYLVIAPKLKWIGEWDMMTQKERLPFFLLMLTTTTISLIIIQLFGNKLLLHLNIIILSSLITLFIITIFWKISLHTSLNTAAVIIVNFLFNWRLPLLYLTIPIIFWARHHLKKHSLNQLIAGVVITASIILGELFVFGYL